MSSGSIPSSPDSAAERLIADFRLRPVVACEIEFYLSGSTGHSGLPSFWEAVSLACDRLDIPVFKIEKERGREQYEIALKPQGAAKAASDAAALKTLVIDLAARHGMIADFSARPHPAEPGSGLHVHVHLTDEQGRNVFYKDDAVISEALKCSIGGLLACLPASMAIFAPYAQSYARFTGGGMAPLTVSWGANNRTVAVRLPDSGYDKRIEHRVAGADADPSAVIAAILSGMHYGLTHRCDPGPQQYGDAARADLPPLPGSLEEARRIRNVPIPAPAHS